LFASGSEIFFDLVLPVIACVLAIAVVTLSNPMHALLSLIGVFLATVLFYISSGIEFIGLVFLIVYVGAVAILFLFVIMLLNVKSLTSLETLVTSPTQVVALAFGALLAYRSFTNIADSLGRTSTGAPAQRSHVGDIAYNVDDMVYHQVMFRESDVNAIAPLYTEHALLFVITTFNLLLALVGAIVLATSTTEQTIKMVPAPVKAIPLAIFTTKYTKTSTAIVLICSLV
jgi:NADH:ubiquinone oxidoreductase subunit 6 (subunit J)